jgi:hypothetical protein
MLWNKRRSVYVQQFGKYSHWLKERNWMPFYVGGSTMSSLSSMTDHDQLSGIPSDTTAFSTFNRPIEEMQSISVLPSGCLWQEVLARMTCEDVSIISSSAGMAREEAQRIEDLQKRDGLRRLLKSWREEDEEEGNEEE